MTPQLVPHASLRWNDARGEWLLMLPEAVVVLNDTAAAVLSLCDGRRPLEGIVEALTDSYADVETEDVADLLRDLADQHIVELK